MTQKISWGNIFDGDNVTVLLAVGDLPRPSCFFGETELDLGHETLRCKCTKIEVSEHADRPLGRLCRRENEFHLQKYDWSAQNHAARFQKILLHPAID